MQFYLIIHKQIIPVITLRCIKTCMIAMIVCNSTLYMTEYVLSKLTFILQSMARLLSLHDLCYAPKRVQLDVIFRSTFFYWYGKIHTLILKMYNLDTDSYIWITIHHAVQYTNHVLESILPSISHGRNNWTMIKPLLYINIYICKYICCKQINPHINGFFHSKINFAKLSKLMPCINKLYLSLSVIQSVNT